MVLPIFSGFCKVSALIFPLVFASILKQESLFQIRYGLAVLYMLICMLIFCNHTYRLYSWYHLRWGSIAVLILYWNWMIWNALLDFLGTCIALLGFILDFAMLEVNWIATFRKKCIKDWEKELSDLEFQFKLLSSTGKFTVSIHALLLQLLILFLWFLFSCCSYFDPFLSDLWSRINNLIQYT
jgi:hypothetical protein